MLNIILIILIYLIIPAIVLRLCAINKFLNKIGAVLLCYVIGFILGQFDFITDNSKILNIITSAAIPLALPLLLFQIDLRSFKKIAKGAILSMFCGIIALLISLFTGYFIFRNQIPEQWKVGGLLVGLYTGGTPNLASIQQALQVNNDTYLAVHTIDLFLGAAYMLFMISIAQRFLSLILPKYKGETGPQEDITTTFTTLSLGKWLKAPNYSTIFYALLASLIIGGLGAGLGLLINTPAIQMAVIILSITTFSLIASFIPKIKSMRSSYDTGIYIILIFSTAIASMADLTKIINLSGSLIGFISFVMLGALFLHILLNRIFKVDVDTTMVTSAALICSPPFVPVVCGAIKNREVMISGITVGIIGYCIGNYLGVMVAYLLHLI